MRIVIKHRKSKKFIHSLAFANYIRATKNIRPIEEDEITPKTLYQKIRATGYYWDTKANQWLNIYYQ